MRMHTEDLCCGVIGLIRIRVNEDLVFKMCFPCLNKITYFDIALLIYCELRHMLVLTYGQH